MAEIPGATVDFTDYSAPGTPRILNVPDVHGDATAQDLWDTLSAIAADIDNLVYKKLLERPGFGGKAVLSATKSTGISLKTNNVKIKFEDLLGPGYTIKRVLDGNVIAQDHFGADIEVMENSTFINWKNEADVSAALVNPLLDQTQLDAMADAVWEEDSSQAYATNTFGDQVGGGGLVAQIFNKLFGPLFGK